MPSNAYKRIHSQNKDREDQSDRLFVIRKMGPAVEGIQWHICQLAQRNFDPSQYQGFRMVNQETAATYVARQEASITTIMHANEWWEG